MSIVPQGPSSGQPESQALLNELQSEVSVEAAPLLQFIIRHAGLIVLLLVLFVVALAGTAGYNWYSARAAQNAQLDLARVVMSTQGADRVAALEKFVGSAPSSIRMAAWLALSEAAMAEQNFDMAAKAFGQVAAADPAGAVGLLAALNEGQALMRAGKAVQALTILEKLESLIPEAQRQLVRITVAEAALLAGNPQRAKTAFEALAAASGGTEAEFYLYRARSLEAAAQATAPEAKKP